MGGRVGSRLDFTTLEPPPLVPNTRLAAVMESDD